MKNFYKTLIASGLLFLLSACAYDPAVDGYYSSSNSYYGQGYRQSPNYGYQGGLGYSGYRQSPYSYSNGDQRPYCPDDDN